MSAKVTISDSTLRIMNAHSCEVCYSRIGKSSSLLYLNDGVVCCRDSYAGLLNSEELEQGEDLTKLVKDRQVGFSAYGELCGPVYSYADREAI